MLQEYVPLANDQAALNSGVYDMHPFQILNGTEITTDDLDVVCDTYARSVEKFPHLMEMITKAWDAGVKQHTLRAADKIGIMFRSTFVQSVEHVLTDA